MKQEWAAWDYGSYARGDSDELSDRDILVVVETPDELADANAWIQTKHPSASPSIYTWSETARMAEYGSLFLHHVRLEGKPLGLSVAADERLLTILRRLGRYKRARRDVSSFATTLCDARISIDDGGSPVFESATIATVIRHAAILACYLLGTPMFGRTAPVDHIAHSQMFEHPWPQSFDEFYRFRLAAAGRCPAPPFPPPERLNRWLAVANEFIQLLDRLIDDYEKKQMLPAA